VDVAKVYHYGKRSLDRWVSAYKELGKARLVQDVQDLSKCVILFIGDNRFIIGLKTL